VSDILARFFYQSRDGQVKFDLKNTQGGKKRIFGFLDFFGFSDFSGLKSKKNPLFHP
jgi:hypothetical protein